LVLSDLREARFEVATITWRAAAMSRAGFQIEEGRMTLEMRGYRNALGVCRTMSRYTSRKISLLTAFSRLKRSKSELSTVGDQATLPLPALCRDSTFPLHALAPIRTLTPFFPMTPIAQPPECR
jgi:hypothetical protein